MLTATLAVVAMAGALSTGATPSPSLQTNYSEALTQASAGHKPMAVFLGHDADKIKRMITDGTISAEAAKILRDKYVCVCLDAEKGAGKDLADRVKMSEGLIISDSKGGISALRDRGTIKGDDLTRQLGQFADPAATTAPRAVYAAPTYGTPVYGGTYQTIPSYGSPYSNGSCSLRGH
jgi:hypothetical protein